MFSQLLAVALLASSALAHSHMFTPEVRRQDDYSFGNKNQNSCESSATNIPAKNSFKRGQKIPVKWWWNNHSGGFIKMAVINKVIGDVKGGDAAALLKNENILYGSCYTRQCDRSGFDSGDKKQCIGADLEFPNWLKDGEYILQWSHFGGFDSQGVPSRQLPIYHNCANIRIQGGSQLKPRPANWIAPFFGGDQVKVNGKSAGKDQCAFKNFAKEPADPGVVNTKDDRKDNIKLGRPDGWAAPGNSNKKRVEHVTLGRLGRVARNAEPIEVDEEEYDHDHHEGDGVDDFTEDLEADELD